MTEAQSFWSRSAVTWPAFSTSTSVLRGKRRATTVASASGVMLSRSPFRMSVGTRGYVAAGGAGGSGLAGDGQRRQASAPSKSVPVHAAAENGANVPAGYAARAERTSAGRWEIGVEGLQSSG